MKKKILFLILRVAKWFGLFTICKRITSKDLRILCYHGAAIGNENHFRPGLFITAASFSQRMQYLSDNDYPVLPLENALERLRKGTLKDNATVITIDDGWVGTYKLMVPILAEHKFPATLYVASYYIENQTQVFNVASAYVAWNCSNNTINLSVVADNLSGLYNLGIDSERECALDALNDYADSLDGSKSRQELLRRFCEALDFDWKAMERNRIISFMSLDEARDISAKNIDIQLHTHRHRFPDSTFEHIKEEIDDNRRTLKKINKDGYHHFCYPSGEYSQWHLSCMAKLDLETAVTTNPGFTRERFAKYELNRFLDADSITPLEFEAEMSGFFELIRRCGYRI